MKKLAVLVVIILVAGLLAGCWLFPEPKLISIVVEPEAMYLDEPGTSSLNCKNQDAIKSVTACYDDWTTKEIEPADCEYLSSDPDIVVVDIVGNEVWVRAVGTGEAYILVSYTERNFPIKVTQEDIVGVFVSQ